MNRNSTGAEEAAGGGRDSKQGRRISMSGQSFLESLLFFDKGEAAGGGCVPETSLFNVSRCVLMSRSTDSSPLREPLLLCAEAGSLSNFN
jgi:hypothetical protein